MSRKQSANRVKNSVQIARQDNHDLIAIGTLENTNNQNSKEFIVQGQHKIQRQKQTGTEHTPLDSVMTHHNNNVASNQSKPDVTDRYNNSSLYQVQDSRDTVQIIEVVKPVTDIKLAKMKEKESKFVNIITTSGRAGLAKVEINSDQADNNAAEDHDQLDDLKLFDSSQMQIIYDEGHQNKITRVRQNYDQIINSPKNKMKLLRRTKQLDRRKEELEEKMKQYSKQNLIEVVMPRQNLGNAINASNQSRHRRAFSNIVISQKSKEVQKRKKKWKQALDIQGFAPGARQQQLKHLRMSTNTNASVAGCRLTTNETIKHLEKGEEIFQQMQFMEDALPVEGSPKPLSQVSKQIHIENQSQERSQQKSQEKAIQITATEEVQMSDTLKSRITPTLSHQFTLMQSLSSNQEKSPFNEMIGIQQPIQTGMPSQHLTSGRQDNQQDLEAQQQISVEVCPVKIANLDQLQSNDISKENTQNNSVIDDEDDMVVMKHSDSKYFKQLKITDFEAKTKANQKRPHSQALNARKKHPSNKSYFQPQDVRQYLSTAQTGAKIDPSQDQSNLGIGMSLQLIQDQSVINSFDHKILSPHSEVQTSYGNFYSQSNKQRASNYMNLRQKERNSKQNKELMKFLNHNNRVEQNMSLHCKGSKKNRKPQIQTRLSSGGGVFFSPKYEHQLQNSKICKFLENSQRELSPKETQSKQSQSKQSENFYNNGQFSPVVCSHLGSINFQQSFQIPLSNLRDDPRKRIKTTFQRSSQPSVTSKQRRFVIGSKKNQIMSPTLEATPNLMSSGDSPKKSLMTPKQNKSRNPLCNLLISKAKDEASNGDKSPQGVAPSGKHEKNFICITPNNLSLDLGLQNKRHQQQLFRVDPERKAAINKYFRKQASVEKQINIEDADQDPDIMIVEGKRSALNSPYDVSICKINNIDIVENYINDAKYQETKNKYQFYEQAVVSRGRQDNSLYPSSQNIGMKLYNQNSRTNRLKSREHSKKSKDSSQQDDREFGTQAQGGSISFVEKEITLSKSSLQPKKEIDQERTIDKNINSGLNTIKDALNIDYYASGHVKFDRGPTPQNLIKIQNERNSTQSQEQQESIDKDQPSNFDEDKIAKCYLELQQQYTSEFQSSALPRNVLNPTQKSIFDMYGQKDGNPSPLNEESMQENPLLVNSKIFSKSQQLRRQRNQGDTISDNSKKYNEDLNEVRVEKKESLQSNTSKKRSINLNQSRNHTHVSMGSHPENSSVQGSCKLSLKQRLHFDEKVVCTTQGTNEEKYINQKGIRESYCSSQVTARKEIAVQMDNNNLYDYDMSPDVIRGSHQYSQEEDPSPNIIKTSTLTGTGQTLVNQAGNQQTSFSFMDKLGNRSFERNKEIGEIGIQAHNAFIIEQQNFNQQMQNELHQNLIRSINSMEKVSMKVKTFECPLPEIAFYDGSDENVKSQISVKKLSNMNVLANNQNKKSQIFFQKGCQRPLSTSTRYAFPLSNRKSRGSKLNYGQQQDTNLKSNISNNSNNHARKNFQMQANRDIECTSNSPKSPTTTALSNARHPNVEDGFSQYNGNHQQIKLYLTHNIDANGNIDGQDICLKQNNPMEDIFNQRMESKLDNNTSMIDKLENRGTSLYLKPDAVVFSVQKPQVETELESKRQMTFSDTQKVLQKDLEKSNQDLKRSNANLQMNDQLPYTIQQISPKHKYEMPEAPASPVFLKNEDNDDSPSNVMCQIEFINNLGEENQQMNETISLK